MLKHVDVGKTISYVASSLAAMIEAASCLTGKKDSARGR